MTAIPRGTARWPRSWVLVALACAAFGGPREGRANDRFDSQQFNPMPSQETNYFNLSTGRVLADRHFDVGLLLNYADHPLVLLDENDARVSGIIEQQVTANFIAAYGFGDIFEIGIDLPVILAQGGEEITDLSAADASSAEAGLGAVRMVPKVQIVRPDEGRTGPWLAMLIDMAVPSGAEEDFQSEGFRAEPRLAFDYGRSGAPRVGLNLGYLVRPEAALPDLEIDDMLTWGVAGDIPFANGRVRLVPEVAGAISVLADDIGTPETPIEALLGLKTAPSDDVLVQLGLGMGLVDGAGAPDYRLFLGISLHSPIPRDTDGDGVQDQVDYCPDSLEDVDGFNDEDGCADPDNDNDAVADLDDDCPDDSEDLDGWEDADGCPDDDNDADGMADANDPCPDDAEDRDGFMDGDGCPDLDDDGDGVADVDDQCAKAAEDMDGWDDADGCPDPDNDGDGMDDLVDGCPLHAETFNGRDDEDGCPEQTSVNVTCAAIVLAQPISFEPGSHVVPASASAMLTEVAETLRASPQMGHLRVEGHTDSEGDDTANLLLSQNRARAVVDFLVGAGVSADRLSAQGFGEARPIASNETAEGRAQNQRIELVRSDQRGCQEPRGEPGT